MGGSGNGAVWNPCARYSCCLGAWGLLTCSGMKSGALTFAAHGEAVWTNLGPLPLLGPTGEFGGLLSVSLWCIVLLHSCRQFTLEAFGIACGDHYFLPGLRGALRSMFLLAEARLRSAACFVFPSPTFGSPR